ncbi:MAG: 50S ribosomal protein L10 [Thermoprotei archaeon]|nr:MAG: 50S ribosomal protein L10 [Thermoprotei archaeon]
MRSWVRAQINYLMKNMERELFGPLVREHRIPEKKVRIVEETAELLRKYRMFAVLDLEGVPNKQFTMMRRILEDKGIVVKVVKNRLFERALRKAGVPNAEEVIKLLVNENAFVFANMNAFELKLLLDKIELPMKAPIGQKVDKEIVVPPGRTELKPGPIMSLFGRFRIPIQVREGVIWIAKEAVVARPGDVVTPELASLLDKLGIQPFYFKPKIKFAYDSGLVIPAEKLVVDVEGVRSDLGQAVFTALSVAAELALPVPEALELALHKAFIRAARLAAEAGFVTPENAELVLSEALRRAYALAARLTEAVPELKEVVGGVQAPQQPSEERKEEKEEKEEEEEKKEVKEEELAEGLAALFG